MTKNPSSPPVPAKAWERRLAELLDRLRRESETYLGYPNNQLLDHQNLAPFLDLVVNNIGDPEMGNFGLHTCEFEREVIAFFSEIYRLSAAAGWGYVTNGGTESNLHGLFAGRERFPDAPLLFSEDAHYSVEKAGRLLGLDREVIKSQRSGEMDYEALEATLARLRPASVIVNANIGTTMKGAIDDVPRIIETLRKYNINEYYIHCDAALFGGFLPFLPQAPGVDFSLPIGSVAISGHKFIGSGVPCGILLTRREHVDRIRRHIDYIGSFDGTISGSRNGLSVLILWQTIQRQGRNGFAEWARQCMTVTRYAVDALTKIGWHAWANPWSNTVVIRRPPDSIARRWHLAVTGDIAHLIIMPGVSTARIDVFVQELVEPREADPVFEIGK